MAFVSAKTGEKVELSRGYESRTITYDEWRRQQEEKKRQSGGTDPNAAASPRLGMTGADTSGEAWTRAAPSQTRIPAPKAVSDGGIWSRGSRYSGIGSNPAAAPSRPSSSAATSRGRASPEPERGYSPGRERASRQYVTPLGSYQTGKDDYRDTWAQGLTGTERRERKEDVHRQLAELDRQEQLAALDRRSRRERADTDTLDRGGGRRKELRASIGEQTAGDRAGDVLTAILFGSAGQTVNNLGTAQELAGAARRNYLPLDIEQKERELERYLENARAAGDEADRQYWEYEAQRALEAIAGYREGLRDSETQGQDTYALADRLSGYGAKARNSAAEGLGRFGTDLVDAAISTGQSVADNTVGRLTGTGLLPFIVRAFGGASQEARQGGADLRQQLVYSTAQAAKEYIGEKLFGIAVPQRISGSGGFGSVDEGIEKVIRYVTDSLAGTPGGKKALGGLMTWGAGGATEALEGGFGALVENLIINPYLRGWDPDTRTGREKLDDAIHDMYLEGLGGLLGVTNLLGYQVDGNATGTARGQAETAAGAEARAAAGVDAPSDRGGLQGVQEAPGTVRGQAPEAAPVQAAPAQRDVIMEAAKRGGRLEAETAPVQQETSPGAGTVEPVHVGRVTTIKRPYQGKTPVQAAKNAVTIQVDGGSVRAAQSRIDGARGLEGTPIGELGGFKATLKKKLQESFHPAQGVAVDGVTFDGKPYLVNINKKVVGKVVNDKNLSAEKIALLDVLQDVVRNGEYVGSGEYVAHSSREKETLRFDYFETPVHIGGQDFIARFDVEVLPGQNNYRTHEIVKIDLTQPEASLAGPAPTASSGGSGPVEGTRPLNSDSTITQPSDSVKPRRTDPLMEAIFSTQKRVDQAALTSEQFDRLADLNEQGTVGMDAAGKVYQVDPAEHIDRRSMDGVGGKGLNAFSFDHPELHGYFKRAAEALIADADLSMQFPITRRYERGARGRQVRQGAEVSAHLRQAMDETGLSRAQLIDAAKRIVEDHGQENAAAAKRVEIILDDMLENGWTAMTGKSVPPDQAYIDAKSRIAGSRAGEARESYIPPELDAGGAIGDDGLGAADAGSLSSAFERMQAQTDTFHPINENAARRIVEEQRRAPSEVPVTNPETGKNITKTVSTILNSPLTSPEMAVEIENAVAAGGFDYIPVTDKGAVQRAQADIADRGLNRVADEFLTRVDLGQRIRKNDIAAAMECYNQALAAGDNKTAFDLAAAISEAVHDGAQVTQAMNLMNRLTPEGRLLTLRRYVDKLNRGSDSRAPRKGAERTAGTDAARADFVEQTTGFRISDELAKRYLLAETDAERSAAWDAITTNLAEQIPSTFREKANFWRYTSMLLNPTTHVRNVLGNGIQAGARSIKNLVGAAIERATVRDQTQRTKSILAGKEGKALKDFARSQYAADQDAAMGAGKYSDASAAGIEREIQSKRKAFQGTNPISKGIQAIGDFNSNAMDVEDVWFNRPAYVDSFAQALKAKGVTAAEAAGGAKADLVSQARAYAIEEARRATYRNTTALSEALSGLGSYRGDNPWKKIGSFAADAFMPFRRTPANILTTGMDYSPLGLVKAAKQGLYDLKRGNATAADVVDSLSAGLTGTGIMALGAYLAAEGLLRVSLGDDDREEAYNKDRGAQKYALQLGGRSYTLDWASPSAMPLLAGASVMESAMDGGSTFEAVMDAMTGISDVVLETSMLSSLNDLISNLSYARNKGTYVLDRAASGYLGQYVPTVGGKIASTADDTVRKSYVETGTGQVASDVDYFLQGVEKKIPGARNTLQPKIDLWGEEVSNGTLPERIFKNFLSPGNLNTMDNSGIDRELRRLEESVGSSAVYPAAVGKSFTVDGERKELTAEEYTKYARKVGQTRRQLVEELMNSEGYKGLDDRNRAAVIASAYEYAGDLGKMEVSGYVPRSGSVTEGALKSPLPTAVYLLYRNSSDRDGNGRTSETESAQTLMEMEGLTDKERGEAWSAFNNKGETEESRERKEAKNPFTGVLAGDYSPEEVMAAWGIFDGKGTKEEPYTQERKKRDLQEELGISAREANDLFVLMKKAAGG